VVIPAYTCVVVPNAFRFAGAAPRFCDIELETFGPDVESVRASITDRTRALVIQHLYGLVSRDYLELLDLAERRGLLVIEDCAHATGADLGGVRVGNRGTVGIYSSEQSKVFNTIMGGVAVANDPAVAERLRQAASRLGRPTDARIRRQLSTVAIAHARANGRGRWVRGDLEVLRSIGSPPLVSTTKDEIAGSRPAEYGCRMPAPIASLGLLQLRKVDAYNARRREAALRWDSWCDEVKLERPLVVPGSRPVFLRYPVIVGPEMKRNREWALSRIGVEVGTWFETHLHPAPGRLEGFPRADVAVDGCVNLPTLS
jgi:perosamine synthetase